MVSKTKKKNTQTKKIIERMTINEFRKKLEGIEMFQPDDWSPTKDQWDLIRQMIDAIVDGTQEQQIPSTSYVSVPVSALDNTRSQAIQIPTSATYKQPQIPEPTIQKFSMDTPVHVPTSTLSNGSNPTQDTPAGKYESDFA